MAQEIGLTAKITPEVDEGELKRETDKMEKRIREKSKALQQFRDVRRKTPSRDMRTADTRQRRFESAKKMGGQLAGGARTLQKLMGTNISLPMPGLSLGGGGFSFGGIGGMSADEPDNIGGLLTAQLSVQEEILQILMKWDGSGVPTRGGGGGGGGDSTFRSRIKNMFQGGGGGGMGGMGGVGAAIAIGGGMAMLGALTDLTDAFKNFDPKIGDVGYDGPNPIPVANPTLEVTDDFINALTTFSPVLGGAVALANALKNFDPVPDDWGLPDHLTVKKPDWVPIEVLKPGKDPSTDGSPGSTGFTVPKEFRYDHYTSDPTAAPDDTTQPTKSPGNDIWDLIGGGVALTGGSIIGAKIGQMVGSTFGGGFGKPGAGAWASGLPAWFAAQGASGAQSKPEDKESWWEGMFPDNMGGGGGSVSPMFFMAGFSNLPVENSNEGSSGSTGTTENTGSNNRTNKAAESEKKSVTVDATVEQHFHIDAGSLQSVKREASREAQRSIDQLERKLERKLRVVQ